MPEFPELRGSEFPEPTAFVHARLPLVKEFDLHIFKWHYEPAAETARFQQAVALAGLDAAISRRNVAGDI